MLITNNIRKQLHINVSKNEKKILDIFQGIIKSYESKNNGLFVVKGYGNHIILFTMCDKNVDQYYELNKTYNNFVNSIKSVINAKTWSELFTSGLQIKFKVNELYTKLKDFVPREFNSDDKDLIIPKKRGFS